MLDNHDLKELAQVTSLKLNLSQLAVEKDFYVTQAIQVLTQIDNPYFALVFQGGTSLSKGYQLVQRLSEDVDFRVIQKPETKKLGKNIRRKKLRDFRHQWTDALKAAEFDLSADSVRVFYEGRFMRINAAFIDSEQHIYLKPHVAVECFMGELALASVAKPITTLMKETIGDLCHHTSVSVDCVALDETAAEKWVALTRRIANSQIKERPSDKHLVRHLYDLYHLNQSSLLSGEYKHLIADLLKKDAEQFQKYNSAYNDNPMKVSQGALAFLGKKPVWREHWENFITQMVYGDNKPSFDKAYESLSQMSEIIFSELNIGKIIR